MLLAHPKPNLSFRRLRLPVLPALVMNSTSPPPSKTWVSSSTSFPAAGDRVHLRGSNTVHLSANSGPPPYPSGAYRRFFSTIGQVKPKAKSAAQMRQKQLLLPAVPRANGLSRPKPVPRLE